MASSLPHVTQQVKRGMSDMIMGALLPRHMCAMCAVPIEASSVP